MRWLGLLQQDGAGSGRGVSIELTVQLRALVKQITELCIQRFSVRKLDSDHSRREKCVVHYFHLLTSANRELTAPAGALIRFVHGADARQCRTGTGLCSGGRCCSKPIPRWYPQNRIGPARIQFPAFHDVVLLKDHPISVHFHRNTILLEHRQAIACL